MKSVLEIKIKDSQIPRVLEVFRETERALINDIKALEQDLSEIRETIAELTGNAKNSNGNGKLTVEDFFTNEKEWDIEWTQQQKVDFVMKKVLRPISTGDIADFIIRNYEPNLDRVKAVSWISSVLTSKIGKQKYAKQKNSANQYVYSLFFKL